MLLQEAFLEGGLSAVLFPWKVVHSSLFFGCPLGLGLKEWTLITGSCKVTGEAGMCRARRRTEAEVGFDPSGRQIMRGLTWVKWRKKWERKIDAVDAYWNNKWLSVTFSAADGTACSQGMLQKARSSWNCKSLGGAAEGWGVDAEQEKLAQSSCKQLMNGKTCLQSC